MVGPLAEALADLDAVHARHHHVEADQVGVVLFDGTERRRAVGSLDHVIALMVQELAQQRPVRGFVIDRQDERSLTGHGRKAATLAANVANSMGLVR